MQVIWYDAARGNWDSGLLCSIFDKHPEVFIQWNVKIAPGEIQDTGNGFDKSIIIVVGRPDVISLRSFLETIPGGLVILTSEEDAYFDWKAAIPSHLEIWTQYYAPSKEGIKTRLLLGAPNRIKDYKINLDLPKKYLWSFVGQVQNPSRQACIEVLKGLPDGFLHIADSFGGVENGIEYQEYLDIMCQSKFVICPAGSMCVDSFRLYEAMECKAIPITEKHAPRDKSSFNYWDDVHLDNQLILVDYWNELYNFMDKGAWSVNHSNEWWTIYKDNLEQKLLNYATN